MYKKKLKYSGLSKNVQRVKSVTNDQALCSQKKKHDKTKFDEDVHEKKKKKTARKALEACWQVYATLKTSLTNNAAVPCHDWQYLQDFTYGHERHLEKYFSSLNRHLV